MLQYRELIWNLTKAELKNRYQNTSLGFLWSLLSPFLLALVLWFVFRNLFQREENFAVNLIVGIVAWRYFQTSTSACLGSILSNQNLVTKLYIPRHILVFSRALSNLISAFLEFLVLIPIVYGLVGYIPLTLTLYPFIHLIMFAFIYGIGLILSAFYVYFRDTQQIWQVFTTALFYACPIFYPMSIVPPYLIDLYMLNPITNFVLIYRDIMVAGTLPDLQNILIILVYTAGFLLLGNLVFNKLQKRFAEEI